MDGNAQLIVCKIVNIIAYFDLGVFANSQVLQTNQIIFLSHEPVGFWNYDEDWMVWVEVLYEFGTSLRKDARKVSSRKFWQT